MTRFTNKNTFSVIFIFLLVLVSVLFHSSHTARAATGINEQFNYQGRLLTSAGAVVPDGTYNMEFKITEGGDGCNPTSGTFPCSGTVKWTETRTSTDKVTVRNGYFSVNLGSVTPFGSSVDWNQDNLWLSVNIGGTGSPSWDGEMKPLKRLGASPYALNSKTLGGLLSSDYLKLAQGVQADATTLSSVFVNKTGASGNILQLQKNGSDVLVVGNGGGLTFGAGLGIDAASGTLTIGDSTASSVSICNSATCDTVSIGTNGDVDTINIGDQNDTTRVIGTFDVGNTPGGSTINIGTRVGADPDLISVGSSNDTLTLTGSSSSTIVWNGTTITAAELNILDGGLADSEIPDTLTITGGTIDDTTTISKSPVITLGSDLSGSVTLTNLANGTLNATVGADAVALGTDTTGNYVSSATTSGGLTLTGTEGGSLGIDLSSADGAGLTSSGSGLEIDTDGIGLLQGCSDTQILKWTEGTSTWACASDATGGGGVADGDKGDITVSASGATYTLDSDISKTFTGVIEFAPSGTDDLTITTDTNSSLIFNATNDSSADIVTTNNQNLVIAPSGTGSTIFSVDSNSNVTIGAGLYSGSAPGTDMLVISDGASPSTTTGVDGQFISFGSSNASGDALHIAPTYAGGATDALTYNGIELDAFSPTNSAGVDTVNGIKIGALTDPGATISSTGLTVGSGWDYSATFSGRVGIGTTTPTVGLQVGSGTNHLDSKFYGDVTKAALINKVGLTNITDIFVYDTTRDNDMGKWTDSNSSRTMSWYDETKDHTASECVIASDDRCGGSRFPAKAILVTTPDALYIFDADDNTMWAKFTQGGTYALGADSNNNPSSVFAVNGVIHVGTNGTSSTGLYSIDFTQDRMYRYNATDRNEGDKTIANRNSTVTYNVNSNTGLKFIGAASIQVNDVHGSVISGSSSILTNGGPLNGATIICAATDDGVQVINLTNGTTIPFGSAIADQFSACFVTKRARMYVLNVTKQQLERYGNPATSNNNIDTAIIAPATGITTAYKTWDESATAANAPNLFKTAQTINVKPDTLEVVERGSLADEKADQIFVGHGGGVTQLMTWTQTHHQRLAGLSFTQQLAKLV